ncbi:unnamed protein product [Cuscuta campestris]|uniref:Uncharacterized protein n=1 Tax=Cuscuta campestris TaxID=132261 RepID=A0A484KJD5_9ASTE|nr:unnamed protein product [Cuscuta campestris]
MNFRSFTIPKKKTGGPSSAAPKTVPVQQEPVEIHSDEGSPLTGKTGQTGRTTVNPPLDKGKGKMGEVGPDALEQLANDSPSRSSQLEEKLKRSEAHNRELQDLTIRQLEEMDNLSRMAGATQAEILRLKEENLKLMEDLDSKELEFPDRAKQWVGENLEETTRVITSIPEVTMEAFKFIYREPNGKEMVTQVGSYGFMSGQKRDLEATHAILAEQDSAFSADAYGLAPIPDEEPEPPFPLE